MLYPIDSQGFVVNQASPKKIPAFYRKLLGEISDLYVKNLKGDLLSIYIRGSVSVGRVKSNLSDVDNLAVTKKELSRHRLEWTVKASEDLEKKYPWAGLIEVTIVSLSQLLNSDEFHNLRVYLKTQSVCLYGDDITEKIPEVRPGRDLAIRMNQGLTKELAVLEKQFSDKIRDREYLYRKRPTEFWCIWMCRTLLRAGMGLVMMHQPIYSQDLRTCYDLFSKSYPRHKTEMKKALVWSVKPTVNKEVLLKYLNCFGADLLNLWRAAINNN